MFDADGDEGRSPGYVGLMVLGGFGRLFIDARPRFITYRGRAHLEIKNFQMFTRFSTRTSGRPNNDQDRYAILEGSAPNSLGPRRPPTFLRDPVLARIPNDYSILVSTAGWTIAPGDTIGVRMAMVFGHGFEDMVQSAMEAKRIYDGFWMDFDGDPSTGIESREFPVCGPRYAGYRVPQYRCQLECLRDPACWVQVPEDGCVWVDADCGTTTGVDGKEAFIPWVAQMPPTAPNMRLVARKGRVDVLWDNRSERLPDPFLQVADFESYRIWKADNWTRPLGTNQRTGPGNALWFLMDEYDVASNGIGKDTGLDAIRYDPAVPAAAVEYYREWFKQHPMLPPPDLPGLTRAQIDTAQALGRGVRYYRYVDPSFVPGGYVAGPCPDTGECPPIQTEHGPVPARCNAEGRCAETLARPQAGTYVFYAVTATDHELEIRQDGTLVATGPGVVGLPNSNFELAIPPTVAALPADLASGKEQIYVVPNPATSQSMSGWTLQQNNEDPSGAKVEFHNLPQSRGRISIYTLAADLVVVIPFDGRTGNGTAPWNLISRNGQSVTSGVYIYAVEAEAPDFEKFVDRFVVIR
jgi:hypothetical protein